MGIFGNRNSVPVIFRLLASQKDFAIIACISFFFTVENTSLGTVPGGRKMVEGRVMGISRDKTRDMVTF